MYETVVSVPLDSAYILDYVCSGMQRMVDEADGISSHVQANDRRFYSLACADTYRFQFKRCLSELTCEALALAYKNRFIRHLLKVDDNNFYCNVLVNVICLFDCSEDKKAINAMLDMDRPLFLDGYYNFRMSALKKRWRELSKLVGDNRYILDDNSLILEFLQYLMQSISCKTDRLSICFEGGGYYLCDGANKVIASSPCFAQNATAEENAVVNAICLKPKLLKIYYEHMPSELFCELVRELFVTDFICVE